MNRNGTTSLALTALFALLVCSVAHAQDTFPASWAGSWLLTEVEEDCGSGAEIATTQRVVLIAEGDAPQDWDEELSFPDAYTEISDTSFDYWVVSSQTLECGTLLTEISCQMTRNGDILTGMKWVNVTSGSCSGTYCIQYDITGTRNPVPVEVTTWGGIKTLYR